MDPIRSSRAPDASSHLTSDEKSSKSHLDEKLTAIAPKILKEFEHGLNILYREEPRSDEKNTSKWVQREVTSLAQRMQPAEAPSGGAGSSASSPPQTDSQLPRIKGASPQTPRTAPTQPPATPATPAATKGPTVQPFVKKDKKSVDKAFEGLRGTLYIQASKDKSLKSDESFAWIEKTYNEIVSDFVDPREGPPGGGSPTSSTRSGEASASASPTSASASPSSGIAAPSSSSPTQPPGSSPTVSAGPGRRPSTKQPLAPLNDKKVDAQSPPSLNPKQPLGAPQPKPQSQDKPKQ